MIKLRWISALLLCAAVLLSACVDEGRSSSASAEASPSPSVNTSEAGSPGEPCPKRRYTRKLGCATSIKADLDGYGALDAFYVLARTNAKGRPIRWFTEAAVGLRRTPLKPLTLHVGYYPRVIGVEDHNGDGRSEVLVRLTDRRGQRQLAVFGVADGQVVRLGYKPARAM